MQKLELLAPAKNFELGKIAIDHGADAVYIAADKFGAREAAGNSLADIEKLVKYAHLYYAKVYLAENTIFYDSELQAARQLAIDAYNIGCDALIIQDMALLEMDLPPIELFASTQCNNQTPQQVLFLQNVGFKRVILARELSLSQIAEIRKNTTVDLETFVHGALCVSYSGQCYLSQAIAGRSANRGCCAQPCRATYDLQDAHGNIIAKNKHLLSLRDMNLSMHVADLVAAGVSSFKIEGRLKDASYIKNVTAFYRQTLDKVLSGNNQYERASSGKEIFYFAPNPEMSFSRGFTNYFIDGKRKKMASIDTAKSRGEEIGKVCRIAKNYFEIKSNKTLINGDGICFFDKNENLDGTKINKVENEKIFPLSMQNIFEGATIYRSYNRIFEKTMEQKTAARQIAAKLNFESDSQKIKLSATDEDGNNVFFETEQCGDIATNAEMAKANIIKNLSKKGDSIFEFEVSAICDQQRFYPISTINAWRRKIADLLLAEREKNYKREESIITKNDESIDKPQLNYTANIANKLARQFYKRHGAKDIGDAFELNSEHKNATLMFNKYCLRYELGLCKKGNAEDLFLVNNGNKLRVSFDCEKCQMKISK